MSSIIYILIGNVGSGKSTWAKKFVKKNPNTVIICRDNIREMLNGKYIFSKEQEPLVMSIRNRCIEEVLRESYNLIVDETSLNRERRNGLTSFIKFVEPRIIINYVIFRTPREKCIENRTKNNKGYSKEKWEEIYDWMQEDFDEPDMSKEWYQEIIEV